MRVTAVGLMCHIRSLASGYCAWGWWFPLHRQHSIFGEFIIQGQDYGGKLMGRLVRSGASISSRCRRRSFANDRLADRTLLSNWIERCWVGLYVWRSGGHSRIVGTFVALFIVVLFQRDVGLLVKGRFLLIGLPKVSRLFRAMVHGPAYIMPTQSSASEHASHLGSFLAVNIAHHRPLLGPTHTSPAVLFDGLASHPPKVRRCFLDFSVGTAHASEQNASMRYNSHIGDGPEYMLLCLSWKTASLRRRVITRHPTLVSADRRLAGSLEIERYLDKGYSPAKE